MAAAPARALAADKRWGFATAAAAAGRAPAPGVVEAAPKPTNLPTQRPMPPASNVWGSSPLLSLKKGEGSGSSVNINDCPSPRSSSTSTDESDLLDSPVACSQASHDFVTVTSRPQSTELSSGSWQFPHSRISFSDVVQAPLRTFAKERPTSNRKGFTICADDFPVLDSKNSQSNGQKGHCFQGQPSFSSVVIATRDEQRKIRLIGGDPVSTANFYSEPEQALHATQTPEICMPPPCIDYWHPPPDHPPDRNEIRLGGVVSYGPCKPADKTVRFPVESFTHDGQSVLNQGREERHGPHGVYHPENSDSCCPHVPVDTFFKSLPHLILEKVKDDHSDALEKQPVIKKDVSLLEKIKCLPHHILGKVKGNHTDALEKQPDIKRNVALLEKIKCLNIKARNLRARNMPEISLCNESKVECPKGLNLKADNVANDVPFSAATSYITSAFDMTNSVSERSNHVLVGTSNMSSILSMTDLSEEHVTEFSEAKKMGNSADNHLHGVADTSTILCGRSAIDTASNNWGSANVPPRPNSSKNTAAAISSTQIVKCTAKKTDISMLEHIAQKTEAESHDSSAPKHLQTEDREGQVHKHESISRASTPASESPDATSPSIPNTITPVKNTEIKIMEPIDLKGVSHTNESRTPMHLQMEEKSRQVHSHERILRGCTPASGPAGANNGSFIHNVIPYAKNKENSMMEHIAWKSESQSHENSSPKCLQVENRQRLHSQERVLRERSNIAESTEGITTVSGTRVNVRNAEANPHMDLSTQSKNRPTSPCLFGTENIEISGFHKAPVSGVVINSSIITMQAPLARGFTVGSIMLGDVSIASVNQEKTVAKEVDDDGTNSCASPKQAKQLGKNQHDGQHAKDAHEDDSIMCKEPSKKERPEAGGVNCMAIPAPNQPSGNQSTVLQNAVTAKTSEIERHAHQPEYKELRPQNPRQMLLAEKHMTSSDNSSTSLLETKSNDKETLHTSTVTQSGIKTEPENWEDISKHLGRSSAASDQVSTNGSATLASDDLTEHEANSLVLKIMQELSDQLEKVEKQLDSIHVAAVSHSEPTQTVSLPGYTWEEHRMSHSQRQYHVDGQGNVWVSYTANVCGFTQGISAPSTTHVLPGPISVPEKNTLNDSSGPVWTWDPAEGILTSDMGNIPAVGTAITSRSGRELTEGNYGVSQMDLHCMQAIGGISYEAVSENPEIQYQHAGLAPQQVNPAWFPHSQQDVSYHRSSGTGVYWPQMDVGAAMQSHGVTGPVVGAGHPGYHLMSPQMDMGAAMQSHDVAAPVAGAGHPCYQLTPVGFPGPAAYTGSAMVSSGHPAVASTWGAAIGEHMYYV